MKINLVFDDWRDSAGNSISYTEAGVRLTANDLHPGSTFACEIELDEDSAADLQEALDSGYVPVFYAVTSDEPDDLTFCPSCGEPWPVTETIRADGTLGCPCQNGTETEE